MKKKIFINFLTCETIKRSFFSESFFSKMNEHLTQVLPKKYGNVEPLNVDFHLQNLQELAELWSEDIFWRNKEVNGYGNVLHSFGDGHTASKLYFDAKCIDSESYIDFFIEASSLFKVDYSSLHLFGEVTNKSDEYFQGISSYDLESFLPGIPWAACYGKPYINLFGEKKILSLPIFRVKRLNDDLIFCQLTEKIEDVITDYENFEKMRKTIIKHLGKEFFLDMTNPKRRCKAPIFRYLESA